MLGNFAETGLSHGATSGDEARSGYYAAMSDRERIEANLGRSMTRREYRAVSRMGRFRAFA